MEIVYCSNCGSMIPPGGIEEGKFFLVEEEPVCPKCYKNRPAEEHTGETLLGEQKVERRKPTDELVPRPKRKSPPSTHSIPAARRPASRTMAAAKRGRAGSETMSRAGAGGRSRAVIALVAALLLLAGVVAFVLTREGRRPARPRPNDGKGSVAKVNSFPISTGTKGDGKGEVLLEPAGESHKAGSLVTARAVAGSGSEFVHWVDTGSTEPSRKLVVDGPENLVAHFRKVSGKVDPEPTPIKAGPGGPIVHWKLDGVAGGRVADSSRRGNAGKALGQPAGAEGRDGKALKLDGVDDHISATRLSGLEEGNSPHTVAAWVRPDELPGGRAWILVLGSKGVGAHHWLLRSSGKSQLGRWGAVQDRTLQVEPTLPVGKWTHLAVTFDGKKLQGYLNGKHHGGREGRFALTGVNLLVGKPAAPSGPTLKEEYFRGAVDDLRVYNRALSGKEIADLAKAGGAPAKEGPPQQGGLVAHWTLNEATGGLIKDRAGQKRDGKAVGRPKTGAGKHASALVFAKRGQRVEIPDFDYGSGGSLAVSMWVRGDKIPGWGLSHVFSHGAFRQRQSFNVYFHGQFLVGELRDAGVRNAVLKAPDSRADGKWHHYAIVVDAVGARAYMDGKPGKVAKFRGRAFNPKGPIYFWHDARLQTPGFSPGALDDVRIYNRALSAAEVAHLASGKELVAVQPVPTVPPAGRGPVAFWQMGGVRDGNVVDSSGNGHTGKAVGALRTVKGKLGNGLFFDGGSGKAAGIEIPDAPALRVERRFTLATWIRARRRGPLAVSLIGKGVVAVGMSLQYDYMLYLGKTVSVYVRAPSGKVDLLDAGFTYADGKWHHLAATYDGKELKLFGDGVGLAAKKTPFGIIRGTTGPLKIGHGLGPFKGSLDDVRVYNRALSAEEIRTLFGGKAGKSAPGAALPAGQVYLADLEVEKVSNVSQGTVTIGKSVEVDGKTRAKCLVMKPGHYRLTSASYDLGGKYSMLLTGCKKRNFGAKDNVLFLVFGDGKEIFKAFKSKEGSPIKVAGVQELVLKCYGSSKLPPGAGAVWVSPRLVKAEPKPVKPAALPAGQVYLADIKLLKVSARSPKQYEIDGAFEVGGKSYPKCLFAAPVKFQAVRFAYSLGGRYASFEAETANSGTAGKKLFSFSAYGDGKKLYASYEPGKVKLDVSGVNLLELKIYVANAPPAGARGVWVSPRLTRAETKSSEPPALPAGQVYLADLKVGKVKTRSAKQYGIGGALEVGGKSYPKCVHAAPRRFQTIVFHYDLSGRYASFEAQTAALGTTGKSSHGFSVFGDGKKLYLSSEPGKVKLDISGVRTLELKVYWPGSTQKGARGAWLSPRLIPAKVPKSAN